MSEHYNDHKKNPRDTHNNPAPTQYQIPQPGQHFDPFNNEPDTMSNSSPVPGEMPPTPAGNLPEYTTNAQRAADEDLDREAKPEDYVAADHPELQRFDPVQEGDEYYSPAGQPQTTDGGFQADHTLNPLHTPSPGRSYSSQQTSDPRPPAAQPVPGQAYIPATNTGPFNITTKQGTTMSPSPTTSGALVPQRQADGQLQCPECGTARPTPRGMGVHRAQVHNVQGNSKTAQRYREAKNAQRDIPEASSTTEDVSQAPGQEVAKGKGKPTH